MTGPLDDFARAAARPMTRGSALKLAGAAVLAAALPGAMASSAGAGPPVGARPRVVIDEDGQQVCSPETKFCRAWTCPRGTSCCPRPHDPRIHTVCPNGGCCDRCSPTGSRCLSDGHCGPGPVAKDCECTPASGGTPCGEDCCRGVEDCIHGECKPYCKTEVARGVSKVFNPETQCCTEHGIQDKYPVRNLEACRKTLVPRPGYKSTSNGCGPEEGPKFPDSYKKANFGKACNAHDSCYGKCGSSEVKCNDKLCKALKQSCADAYPRKRSRNRRNCREIADTYCDGVRLFGGSAFESAQSKACQCCP